MSPLSRPPSESARRLLETRKHILLCCDCEGTREQLERLVGALERVGVAATFFFVGDTARDYPDLVRRVAATQQVESHTMHHENLRGLSKEDQRRAIVEGRRAVEDVIGRPTRGFRAPYHALNRRTIEILRSQSGLDRFFD